VAPKRSGRRILFIKAAVWRRDGGVAAMWRRIVTVARMACGVAAYVINGSGSGKRNGVVLAWRKYQW